MRRLETPADALPGQNAKSANAQKAPTRAAAETPRISPHPYFAEPIGASRTVLGRRLFSDGSGGDASPWRAVLRARARPGGASRVGRADGPSAWYHGRHPVPERPSAHGAHGGAMSEQSGGGSSFPPAKPLASGKSESVVS